ncbi:MAG: hypothetical protein JWP23_3055 [Phenylobacterium sp.]|nr:hypothetical protein [Phenylobacterium sp.]
MKAVEFIRDTKRAEPNANKAFLLERYVEAFGPERLRSVFVGDGYALRFSEAWGGGFANTVLSLSALQQHDRRPFAVVLARPDRVDFLLSNSTFLKKVSHSSRDLRVDNIRGSFNGTDILSAYEGMSNEPNFFPELFAVHDSFSWEENVERLVETTNAIVARQNRFGPTAAQRDVLMEAPDRARQALTSPAFAALEKDLQGRVASRRDDILVAAKLDNVNLRGEAVERLLLGGRGGHALGDFEAKIDGAHTVVDVKTKLLDRASAPKAYNVDKALEFMSRPDSVLAFLMVGIDTAKESVSARLLPVLEASLLDVTAVQHHWAGRASRGVTQLSGDFHRAAASSYAPTVDVQKARQFLERLLAL